jgi:hypothetical protein
MKPKAIAGLFAMFVSLPIWYTLMFQLLKATNIPEWVWVLYWIYVPVTFLLGIITNIVGD